MYGPPEARTSSATPRVTERVWRSLATPPAGFADSLGLPSFQAHLLYNRGVRQRSEAERYLAFDSSLLNDPMLLPDMGVGVARLNAALTSGESIGIFGDFDADGVTGTALLVRGLRHLGATVFTYLPDRVAEGHGLNDHAIKVLQGQGVTLLLTVDCGATSVEEVALAGSLGMDVIVTDHHSMVTKGADAYALINPGRSDSAYPFAHLTGVGVSFKLMEALYADLGQAYPEDLMELVALGTVADVGWLIGENRYFVTKGLERINATQSPGLQALIARSGLVAGDLDAQSLSFGLIPRINVAGRLGHAGISLDLLTASTREMAEPLADELDRKNGERQRLTEQGVAAARIQIEERLVSGDVPSIVIVSARDWVPGILGLIAGRLSEHYHRPAIAIELGDDVSRASARSIPEFDIVKELAASRDLLIKFGGHSQAAGFTLPTRLLPTLQQELETVADERLRGLDLSPRIEYDCEVSPAVLPGENFAFIQSLSPFGHGNPAPIFLTREARVVEARQVGKGGNHLKMRVSHGGEVWEAIAFRQGDMLDAAGGRIDLLYTVGLNNWGGRSRMELTVREFRPSS